MDPSIRERIQGWVSDVCLGDGMSDFAADVQGAAAAVLGAWLEAACEPRRVGPEALELDDLRTALLGRVARLDLTPEVHAAVPALCRHALAELERTGRLEDGERLGSYLYAMGPEYARVSEGRTEPLRRPGAKLGRNDPCPCGSGKKWKRCCGGATSA